MSTKSKTITTSHGDVAVTETSGTGMPVLFLHGNSSSKEVFRKQLESTLGDTYRLIAIDLPGHGASSDARDPQRTYSLPGLAAAATEALEVLGVDSAAVVGWSLGGHVAMEMTAHFPGMRGLMVVGAPPISATVESIQAGFKPNPIVMLIGKEDFSAEEAEAFGSATYGVRFDDSHRKAIKRADGRLRRMTFENLLAGLPVDEKKAVETSGFPVAFVNGADDPFVNLDYIGGLTYRNLWDNHSHHMRGAGHTPFMEVPDAFNALLGRFLDDVAKQKAAPARKSRSAA